MATIFLDFDGVLNCLQYERCNSICPIDENIVKRLQRILDQTGAEVVLSTSWRHFWEIEPKGGKVQLTDRAQNMPAPRMIQDVFDKYQITLSGRTGKTHRSDTRYKEYNGQKYFGRGLQILEYILDHNIENYVILDDDLYDLEPLMDRVVATSYYRDGLTDELAERAIRILNR